MSNAAPYDAARPANPAQSNYPSAPLVETPQDECAKGRDRTSRRETFLFHRWNWVRRSYLLSLLYRFTGTMLGFPRVPPRRCPRTALLREPLPSLWSYGLKPMNGYRLTEQIRQPFPRQ